jgi:heme exporter protein C
MYAIALVLTSVRAIILEREAHTEWVKELPEVKGNGQ